MIVYDINAQYTDKFNEYLNNTLEPLIDALCDNAVEWLESNGAQGIDYLLIKNAIVLDISYILEMKLLNNSATVTKDSKDLS